MTNQLLMKLNNWKISLLLQKICQTFVFHDHAAPGCCNLSLKICTPMHLHMITHMTSSHVFGGPIVKGFTSRTVVDVVILWRR